MSEAELHILEAGCSRRGGPRRGAASSASPCPWATCAALRRDRPGSRTSRRRRRSAWSSTCSSRFGTIGKVLRHLADARHPDAGARAGRRDKGELEWRRPNRPSLHSLFVNPIYAGTYAYGVRPTDRRRQKPGHPKTGRTAPTSTTRRSSCRTGCPPTSAGTATKRTKRGCGRTRPDDGPGPRRQRAALGASVCGRCGLRMTAQPTTTMAMPPATLRDHAVDLWRTAVPVA